MKQGRTGHSTQPTQQRKNFKKIGPWLPACTLYQVTVPDQDQDAEKPRGSRHGVARVGSQARENGPQGIRGNVDHQRFRARKRETCSRAQKNARSRARPPLVPDLWQTAAMGRHRPVRGDCPHGSRDQISRGRRRRFQSTNHRLFVWVFFFFCAPHSHCFVL